MTCLQAPEKAMDSFDFLQDSELFSHRLNWLLVSPCLSSEGRAQKEGEFEAQDDLDELLPWYNNLPLLNMLYV